MTPTMALGGSCTLESVAVLVNELKRGLDACPGAKPSKSDIQQIFCQYQKLRESRVRMVFDVTHAGIRMQSQDSHIRRLRAKLLALWMGDNVLTDRYSALIRGAVKFSFLTTPERGRGIIGFDDEKVFVKRLPRPGNSFWLVIYSIALSQTLDLYRNLLYLLGMSKV